MTQKCQCFFAIKIRCSDGVEWTCAKMACGHGYLQQCDLKTCPSEERCILIEMNHFSHRTPLTSLQKMLQKMILWNMIWGIVGAPPFWQLDNAASRGWWRYCQYHLFGTSSYKETLTQATHGNGKSPSFQQDVHPCSIECALQKNGWWIISTSSVQMFYPRTVSQKFLDWYGNSRKEIGSQVLRQATWM